MTFVRVRQAQIDEILPVRTRVLRPHFGPGEFARWSEDEKPTTHHFAAFHRDDAIGCVTFQLAAFPADGTPLDVQLRGMAVDESYRGEGVGAELLEGAYADLAGLFLGSETLWCNARQRAITFYERAGFEGVGALFEIEGIGPHLRMLRSIP